ncbi:MAG: DUF3300 domain-containing protein, partial [Burkholderiales bacterium]
PIALHPDGVLSNLLVAATQSEDLRDAAAWSRGNPQLAGDDALRAAEPYLWHPSVKSLVAFPELLARLGESPQWVLDVGDAFLTQQAQVMDTVQGLRRRAQANGHLASSPQQTVYQQDEAIVVYPRSQIVYVHYYDPYVVYGPWWWPHYRPVYWRPWAPRPVFVAHFHSTPHWHHRRVHVHPRRHHAQPRPHHAQPHQFHRVPESRRQPIVPSMPAASAFSQQRRDVPRVQQQQGAQFRPNTIKHNPSSGVKQQAQRR